MKNIGNCVTCIAFDLSYSTILKINNIIGVLILAVLKDGADWTSRLVYQKEFAGCQDTITHVP